MRGSSLIETEFQNLAELRSDSRESDQSLEGRFMTMLE